jgi:8-amino-7-oxononanoate synthase
MSEAAEKYGVGSSASPLICGRTVVHQRLESRISECLGRDRALLFSCGYMANLALVSVMAQTRRCEIILDRLCHASIIDGVLATGKRFHRYPHLDLESLQSRLRLTPDISKLVLTESVFSMDGDIAPLDKIAKMCGDNDARLVVDDAHGLGVLGKTGFGAMEHFNLDQQEVSLVMGTFGKSLGGQGAFVAGNEADIEYLIQHARPYIYSTSLPVPVVAAVLEALRILTEEPQLLSQLHELIDYFQLRATQLGFRMGTNTAIQPLIIGPAQKTMEVCKELEKRGLFVMGIRPPTVQRGKSRLRITLSASHNKEDLDHLLNSLEECRKVVGF